MIKSNITAIVIVLLLIVGGGLFFANQQSQKAEQAKMAQEKAAMKAKEDAAMKEKESMMKKDMGVMEMAMKDSTSKQATLTNVSGGTATGKAFLLRKDGKLLFTASSNLPDPKEGTFYEGWIVKKDTSPAQYEDTGKLKKQKDGSYEVSKEFDETYEGYDFVVITSEQADDQKPEKHILEGTAQ